jgi:hypothetical protein
MLSNALDICAGANIVKVEEGNRCTAILVEIWTSVLPRNQCRKHNNSEREARVAGSGDVNVTTGYAPPHSE